MPGETPESGDGRLPAPKASSDVFVSYASPDAAVADAVVAALERHGVKCWIAPRDVTPGEFYADAIVGAINATRIVVVVLTGNAVGSPHVLREIERASAKRHPVVSFRIDTVPLPAGLEYFLSASHWLDATVSGIDSALPRLVEAAQRLLAPAAAVEPGHQADTAPPAELFLPRPAAEHARAWLTRPIVATVAVIAVIAVYLAVDKLGLLKHVASDLPVAAVTPATTRATRAISDKSIAVLPFVDLSEKKDQEYFADGMAEEVLDLLAKVPGLTVIGRTSSFQFKGTNQDLRAIGSKIGAAFLVEGSVRRSSDRVRVTAQLVEARNGAHRWSETYDRPASDALQVQDEIALSLARALQVGIGADRQVSNRRLKNDEAYDLYLRGRYAAERNDVDGLAKAATYLRQALEIDSTFADAAVALAETYYWQANNSMVPAKAGYERTRRAAEAALKLDPRSGIAHAILGATYSDYDRDWLAADREFKEAVALAPHSGVVLVLAAQLPLALGQDAVARQIYKEALAYDPLSPNAYWALAWVELHSGNWTAAEAAARRTVEIDPLRDWGAVIVGFALLFRGDREAALAEMKRDSWAISGEGTSRFPELGKL